MTERLQDEVKRLRKELAKCRKQLGVERGACIGSDGGTYPARKSVRSNIYQLLKLYGVERNPNYGWRWHVGRAMDLARQRGIEHGKELMTTEQKCGHPAACIVSADDGTSYCAWCEWSGREAEQQEKCSSEYEAYIVRVEEGLSRCADHHAELSARLAGVREELAESRKKLAKSRTELAVAEARTRRVRAKHPDDRPPTDDDTIATDDFYSFLERMLGIERDADRGWRQHVAQAVKEGRKTGYRRARQTDKARQADKGRGGIIHWIKKRINSQINNWRVDDSSR